MVFSFLLVSRSQLYPFPLSSKCITLTYAPVFPSPPSSELLSLSLFEGRCDYVRCIWGMHLGNARSSSLSRFVITSAHSLLPCMVTFPVLGTKMWIYLGAIVQPTTLGADWGTGKWLCPRLLLLLCRVKGSWLTSFRFPSSQHPGSTPVTPPGLRWGRCPHRRE